MIKKKKLGNNIKIKQKSQNPKESLLGRLKKKNDNQKYKLGFYYSFLTFVLLVFLIQILVSTICNITKTISYKSKISTITKTLDEVKNQNRLLNEEYRNLSSNQDIEYEAMIRNQLKLSAPDEVLVIINSKSEQEQETKTKTKKSEKK